MKVNIKDRTKYSGFNDYFNQTGINESKNRGERG